MGSVYESFVTAENRHRHRSRLLAFLTVIYFYIPFSDPGHEYGGLRLIL